MQTIEKLKQMFSDEAYENYTKSVEFCKKFNVRPPTKQILSMYSRTSPYQVAVELINKQKITEGFTALWLANNSSKGISNINPMVYTLEAQALKQEYLPLFDEQTRNNAIKRLKDYEFSVDEYINSISYENVRILPMNKATFNNAPYSSVQSQFFMQKLPYENKNKYYYEEHGINCNSNDIILFQYDNMIIASARFNNKNINEKYIGLVDNSIFVFEPITIEDLKSIAPTFNKLGNSMQYLRVDNCEKITRLIEAKEYIPEPPPERVYPTVTEKETIIKARVGQGKYRDKLLQKYNSCCALCNINNSIVLTASHIKPWSKSNGKEKIDIDNGFLLCSLHDTLFDAGLISIDLNGKLIVSSEISPSNYTDYKLNNCKTIDLSEQNKQYLQYHIDNILIK